MIDRAPAPRGSALRSSAAHLTGADTRDQPHTVRRRLQGVRPSARGHDRRRGAHRVRQGCRPPDPSCRQDPRRPLRARHRSRPHHAAGSRDPARARAPPTRCSPSSSTAARSSPCPSRSSATRSSAPSSTSTSSSSAAARRSPSTSRCRSRARSPDALVEIVAPTVPIEAEATHIPEQVVGRHRPAWPSAPRSPPATSSSRRASTLSGLDPEALVVNIVGAPSAAQVEAELAEAEAEAGIEPTLADDESGNEAPEQPQSSDEDAEGAANA